MNVALYYNVVFFIRVYFYNAELYIHVEQILCCTHIYTHLQSKHSITNPIKTSFKGKAVKEYGTPTQQFQRAVEICEGLRREIRKQTGFNISVGIARSKVVAKVCCSKNKPDGVTVVYPDAEVSFIQAQKIRKIWGLKRVLGRNLSLFLHPSWDRERRKSVLFKDCVGMDFALFQKKFHVLDAKIEYIKSLLEGTGECVVYGYARISLVSIWT